jgi:glyoxylase-like metal-dependent hydrolase (beta-lactamase superfamily II)
MSTTTAIALGPTTIQRVIDLDPYQATLGVIFPGATLAALEPAMDLLAGRHVDRASSSVLLAMQSFVLRIAGKTILVDACVGEHKSRPLRPLWNDRSGTPFLANLAAAGCAPEDIDIVMCTHLHADHVGWNTRLESGRWVPTFPNARYLMTQGEIDQRSGETAEANHGSYQDSVLPILDRGLATIIADGDEIADGAKVIALPGHSPGQVGLDIATGGTRALFCGDAIHSPVQVFHPQWSSAFCFDPAQSAATRHALLARAAGEDLLLVPAHLRAAGMRIREKGGSFTPVIDD